MEIWETLALEAEFRREFYIVLSRAAQRKGAWGRATSLLLVENTDLLKMLYDKWGSRF